MTAIAHASPNNASSAATTRLAPHVAWPSAGGLRVERTRTAPGPVALHADADHRIRMHAGAPVSGICGGLRFRYERGHVDLLPAGSASAWHEDGASTSIVLRFAPAFLRAAADDLGLDGARVDLAARHQLRDPQIEHIAWALDADRAAGHPSGALYPDSLAVALAAHLLNGHRAPHTSVRGLTRTQLRRVTEHIDAHLDQDLSLLRLADVAGISASSLKTLFKRSTGLPVHAYVVRRRVDRARSLLLQRNLPASRIALDAGFAHQSHMVRCLRRVLGDAAAPLLRRG